jgi:hypothetical protein
LEYEKAYEIIWQWLEECAKLRRLEPSRSYFDRYVVKHQLELAQDNGIPAMTESTLQEKYPELYNKALSRPGRPPHNSKTFLMVPQVLT